MKLGWSIAKMLHQLALLIGYKSQKKPGLVRDYKKELATWKPERNLNHVYYPKKLN